MRTVSYFSSQCCADPCMSAWVGKIAALLIAYRSTNKWNFANLKNIKCFFQICKTPLGSALKEHAKYLDLFCLAK
jgi:hypothetical protein